MITETITHFQKTPIKTTTFKAENEKAYIIYIHGGGLLLGHRNDLPTPYIHQLQNNGFTLITVDYPLAPQVDCNTILDTLTKTVSTIIETYENIPFFIFGRSAGAFLALSITKHLQKQPAGLISFYGYFDLSLKEFHQSVPFYLNYPLATLPTMDDTITCHRTDNHLLPLYLYARQTGNWLQLLQIDTLHPKWLLTEADFAHFPPAFISACVYDADVPYSQSSLLSRLIPNSQCHTLFEKMHTFDEDMTLGTPIYDKLILWLQTVVVV